MMNLLQPLDVPVIQRIGWTLLQGLWQGAAIALILAALLPLTRRPRLRYAMACVALLTMTIAAAMTFAFGDDSALTARTGTALTNRADTARLWFRVNSEPAPPGERPNRAAGVGGVVPLLVGLWIVGVVAQAIRQCGAWLHVQRWRRGVAVDDPTWLAILAAVADRLRIRRAVRLLCSTQVDGPAVLGLMRPVILVPLALLNDLSAQQAQAILAHELAHIRRLDYVMNLMQTAIETIFFHHPAVWWISAQIRRERENCCDDIAASICGGAVAYAGALLKLEEHRARSFALAASDGSLLGRIRRLVGAPAPGHRRAKSALAAILALLCVLAPLGWQRIGRARAQDLPTTSPARGKSQFTFYHVTIGDDGFIAVNGGVGNWQTLRDDLAMLPIAQRAKVVISLSAETEDLPVGKYFEAQAQGIQLVKDLGLAYLSNTGVERRAKAKQQPAYIGGDAIPRTGVYDISSDGAHRMTIRQLIIAAGGIDPKGAPVWITLIRRSDGAETFPLMDYPVDAQMKAPSLDLYLQPDDTLEVITDAKHANRPRPSSTRPADEH
jgi:beta-lactamase regulating signal transducer with metallopeptidase domain